MTTHSPLALCPVCFRLIPMLAQLGTQFHLYCGDSSHWAGTGIDAETVSADFQQYKQMILEPTGMTLQEIDESVQQIRDEERRMADLRDLIGMTQLEIDARCEKIERMAEAMQAEYDRLREDFPGAQLPRINLTAYDSDGATLGPVVL